MNTCIFTCENALVCFYQFLQKRKNLFALSFAIWIILDAFFPEVRKTFSIHLDVINIPVQGLYCWMDRPWGHSHGQSVSRIRWLRICGWFFIHFLKILSWSISLTKVVDPLREIIELGNDEIKLSITVKSLSALTQCHCIRWLIGKRDVIESNKER